MHEGGRTSLQRKIHISVVQHAQRLVQLGAMHMQDVDPPARIARPLVLWREAPCRMCTCEQASIRLEQLAADHHAKYRLCGPISPKKQSCQVWHLQGVDE